MTGHFDWKNGSGGEHHYATIFLAYRKTKEII